MYFIGFLFFRPLCWVFIAAWVFSSCGKQGLLSSCDVQASHCGIFFCCEAQVLGKQAQWLWYVGLFVPQYVGYFQTRDQTQVPSDGR